MVKNQKIWWLKLFVIIILANSGNYAFAEKIMLPIGEKCRAKTAIALTGGGARGFAQIGAIKALEENNIPIDYVIGTSFGAIVGGLYSSGYSSMWLDSMSKNTNWNELLSIVDKELRSELFSDQKEIIDRSIIALRFHDFQFVIPETFASNYKYRKFIQALFWNSPYKPRNSFDNLKIPFRAIALDISKGRSVVLDSCDIIKAVLASSTVPLRFSPIRIDSMILVDGGLKSNLPTKEARLFSPDIIIGVNTISPLWDENELKKPWNLLDQIFNIAMKHFSDSAEKKADILISPELEKISNVDFDSAHAAISAGYTATINKIEQIKASINAKNDSICRLYDIPGIFDRIKKRKIIFKGLKENDEKRLNKIIKKGNHTAFYNFLINVKGYSKISVEFSDNKSIIQAEKLPIIKNINIISEDIKNIDSLKNKLRLFNGLDYSNDNIQNLEAITLRFLRENDYSFGQIDTIFLSDNILNLSLSAGRINKIIVTGNDHTEDYLIIREINFKEGDILDAIELQQGWQNIINTGLFTHAEISIEEDNNGHIVKINVKEAGQQIIRVGARVDNERNGQVGIDLIQENFLNSGTRLSFRFAGGVRNQNILFKIHNPRIANSLISLSFDMYYKWRRLVKYSLYDDLPVNRFLYRIDGSYAQEYIGTKAILGRQIDRQGLISLTFKYEHQQQYDLDTSKRASPYSIATITPAFNYDSEDRPDFPTKGVKIDLSLETTLFQTQDNISFSKIWFYYKLNNSIGNHTIIRSINLGAADITTPSTEFFSLGGQYNFFGFREDQNRGRQLFKTSLEYRYKMPFQIIFDTYFSIRYDLGSSWTSTEQIKIKDFTHGIGSTLSWDTPLGPANISIGRAFKFLNRKNTIAYGDWLMYFSVGMNL